MASIDDDSENSIDKEITIKIEALDETTGDESQNPFEFTIGDYEAASNADDSRKYYDDAKFIDDAIMDDKSEQKNRDRHLRDERTTTEGAVSARIRALSEGAGSRAIPDNADNNSATNPMFEENPFYFSSDNFESLFKADDSKNFYSEVKIKIEPDQDEESQDMDFDDRTTAESIGASTETSEGGSRMIPESGENNNAAPNPNVAGSIDESQFATASTSRETPTDELKCEFCSQRFSIQNDLICHRRIHIRDKPYHCHLCQMRFSCPSALTNHNMIHTGEKPFQCEVCHKKFARKSNVGPHMRIHTGEKPFLCDICGKSFSLPHHFKYHKKTHRDEN